jgi:predicted DNA-binding transcriptional regulator AlpA
MPQLARPKPPHELRFESDQELNARERLLTAKDAASLLRLSASWLAKARMRGDGPPYLKLGRSVRYSESALAKWTRTRARLSTSER